MKLLALLSEPEVLASLISGTFAAITALVPTFVVWHLSKRFLGNKRYIRMGVYAMREIVVLRAVMDEMGDNKAQLAARKRVSQKLGMKTENRFTRGALAQKLESYEQKLDETLPPIENV